MKSIKFDQSFVLTFPISDELITETDFKNTLIAVINAKTL